MTRVCKSCLVEKPLEDFHTYNSGYGIKPRWTCRKCKNESLRGTRAEASKRYYDANLGKMKEDSAKYYKSNKGRLQEYGSVYYFKNKEKVSLRVAAKAYGITEEEVKELRQGNCAICGTDGSEYKKSMHIDHCHETGKVRGSLCHSCNTALGLFKDNIVLLDKAKEYLLDSVKSE